MVALPDADSRLAAAVRAALEGAPRLETLQVFSKVRSGVVTLSGIVNSVSERMEAKNAALSVPGVVTIVDSLVVPLPADTSDAEIAAAVEVILRHFADPVKGFVQAEIRSHVVRLTGSVADEHLRTIALRLIGAVPQVDFVDDRLAVGSRRAPTPPPLLEVRRAG